MRVDKFTILVLAFAALLVLSTAVAPAGGDQSTTTAVSTHSQSCEGVRATDSIVSEAVAPEPNWLKRYDNRTKGDVRIHDIVETSDGYTLVGETTNTGNRTQTAIVVKVDDVGDVEWVYRSTEPSSVGFAAVPHPEGGVTLVGKRDQLWGGQHGWAVSITENGSCRWTRTFGDGHLTDIARSETGDVVAVGESEWRPFAVKLGRDGDTTWSRSYERVDTESREEVGIQSHTFAAIAPSGDRSEFVVATSGVGEWEDVGAIVGRIDEAGNVVSARVHENTTNFASILALENRFVFGTTDGRLVSVNESLGDRHDVRFSGAPALKMRALETDGEFVYAGGNQLWRVNLTETNHLGSHREVIDTGVEFGDGTVNGIVPTGGGFVVIAGTLPGQYVEYANEGYLSAIDQRNPGVELVVNATSPEVGVQDVRLRADSTDNDEVRTYQWDVDGDGVWDETTTDPTYTHVYQGVTQVNTTVRVTDGANNSATDSVPITPTDTTRPAVNLTAPLPRLIATSAPARLDARESTDNLGIKEYRWDIGADGTVDVRSNDSGIRYRFQDNRTYPLRLTVVDASGHTNNSSYHLDVVENDQPRVVDVEGEYLVVNESARLTVNVSNRVGTPTTTWVLPNGSRQQGRVIDYTFRTTGEQNVSVVVTDEYGGRAVKNVSFDVSEPRRPADHIGLGPLWIVAILFALAAKFLVPLAVLLIPVWLLAKVIQRTNE